MFHITSAESLSATVAVFLHIAPIAEIPNGVEPMSPTIVCNITAEFEFSCDGLEFGALARNNVSGLGRFAEGVMRNDGRNLEVSIPIERVDLLHDRDPASL